MSVSVPISAPVSIFDDGCVGVVIGVMVVVLTVSIKQSAEVLFIVGGGSNRVNGNLTDSGCGWLNMLMSMST